MRKGFFDGLSETLTRTTKDLSKKAGQIYETQKIQSKVSSEEHMVEKLKCDIGNLVFSRYSGTLPPHRDFFRHILPPYLPE